MLPRVVTLWNELFPLRGMLGLLDSIWNLEICDVYSIEKNTSLLIGRIDSQGWTLGEIRHTVTFRRGALWRSKHSISGTWWAPPSRLLEEKKLRFANPAFGAHVRHAEWDILQWLSRACSRLWFLGGKEAKCSIADGTLDNGLSRWGFLIAGTSLLPLDDEKPSLLMSGFKCAIDWNVWIQRRCRIPTTSSIRRLQIVKPRTKKPPSSRRCLKKLISQLLTTVLVVATLIVGATLGAWVGGNHFIQADEFLHPWSIAKLYSTPTPVIDQTMIASAPPLDKIVINFSTVRFNDS